MNQRKSSFYFVPLFIITALGLYLGSQGGIHITPAVLAIASVFIATWVYLEYRGVAYARHMFWIILLACACLVGYVDNIHVQWDGQYYDKLQGRVRSVTELSNYQRVIIRLTQLRADIAVHIPLEAKVAPYDSLMFSGDIVEPPMADNPGAFCYKSFLARQNVYGLCWPEWFAIDQNKTPPHGERFAALFRRNIERNVEKPGLLFALVLGNRDFLEEVQINNWRQLGISHLIAISGMHISLIAAICTMIVVRLPLNHVVCLVIVQTLLLGYVLIITSVALIAFPFVNPQ